MTTHLSWRRTTIAVGLIAALISANVNAQETVSALRGIVTDEQGTPLSGSSVQIRNEATGLTRTVRTNESGEFSVRNLPIGDDYSVSVTKEGHAGEKAEGITLNLGQTASLTFDLASSSADSIEEVVIVGSAPQTAQVAVGPSAVFGLDSLEEAPAINRNITDVIRADARIYVDESQGAINSVQCGGKNPRFNSFTLDGTRINDSFGLNASAV